MPRGDKSTFTDKPRRHMGATEESPPKGAAPNAAARGWASANRLHRDGKKIDARRNLPSGQLGGSGRKTNLSRSS